MNKLYKTSLLHNTLIAAVLVVLFVPHLALAQATFLQETLWSVINAVFGFFAWIGGQTLNYAVTHYVVGFGHNFLESGTGYSVNILWTVVRDVFNLTFIFGLVYIGLKMILRSDDSQARSMLISLILAALLVNFSLFITKFVIDFSNIAAAQIAAAFPIQNGTHSVSSSFMNILGFNDLFSPGSDLNDIAGSSVGYTYIFSTMFLYIILAFVFMAGGIMLIIRYIVLIIYMILSPVMFLGWVFPGMASVSHDYWKKFMSRAFFAPAYLLMLYFANQVLVSMQGANGMNTGSYGAVFSGQTSTVGNNFGAVIPFFFMTAAFLVASLVVAQKMGAHGADSAVSMGRQAAGRFSSRTKKIVGGGTAGAAAIALQRSVGYGAQRYANTDGAKQRAANSMIGAGILKASRAVGNTSFDVRQVGDLGKNLGVGTGTKGGYQSRIDAKAKDALDGVDRNNITEEGLAKLESDLKKAENSIEKKKADLLRAQSEALESAEASVTYEKQLAFIKRRESEANFMTSRITNIAGTGAGMYGAGTAAGMVGAGVLVSGASVLGGGMIAAPIAHSFGTQSRESVGNLRKTYGVDGTAAIKDKSKKENLRILAEQMKDAGIGAEQKEDK